MEVYVAGALRPVHIERKRNRYMYLYVNDDGSLRVTCHRLVPQYEIKNFILEKEKWIEENLKKKETSSLDFSQDKPEYIYWLGERIHVFYEPAKRNGMEKRDNYILFKVNGEDASRLKKIFYRHAAKYIVKQIEERRKEWDNWICVGYGKEFPKITVKYMTSQWGSCNQERGKISISSRLIHYPIECLDYVLLHEYSHLVVPNHSDAFWELVETYMPDYEVYDKMLGKPLEDESL